ncbi:hypothetical protein B0T20DRAFT_464992 [Sordaria brevicollis]|uniref:Uncharacterized protein n=1 Tax=Sordaria brevicollis TaxID=83679 RepID=A0AAE0U314_SORBR|nr:hypothetical protein B0T20DRAFT_464992 [Sordaria brevicollis]
MAGQQNANGSSAVPPTSTKSAGQSAGDIPENLFHTTLTVIDYHAATCGAINCLHVLATHTTEHAAKAFAFHDALRSLNYQPSDFSIYATRESISMPAATSAPAESTTTPKPTTVAAKVAESSGAYESGYTTDTGTSDTDTGGGGGPQTPIWPYGDEVLVYAKAPAGQEFLIGVVETPNTEHLVSGGPVYGNTPLLPKSPRKSISSGSPTSKFKSPLPGGAVESIEKDEESQEENEEDSDAELSYVIQTKTDYNQALPSFGTLPMAVPRRRRSSITRLFQACEIKGCFPHKSEAIDFARNWLGRKKDSGLFVQYDEREPRAFSHRRRSSSGRAKHTAISHDIEGRLKAEAAADKEEESGSEQWPFGEDVLVHAVAATGENYCVAVRTAEGARERFGKKMTKGRQGSDEAWVRSYYEDSPTIQT